MKEVKRHIKPIAMILNMEILAILIGIITYFGRGEAWTFDAWIGWTVYFFVTCTFFAIGFIFISRM